MAKNVSLPSETVFDQGVNPKQIIGHREAVPFGGGANLVLLLGRQKEIHPFGLPESLPDFLPRNLPHDLFQTSHVRPPFSSLHPAG
jgi:hypothetical protein